MPRQACRRANTLKGQARAWIWSVDGRTGESFSSPYYPGCAREAHLNGRSGRRIIRCFDSSERMPGSVCAEQRHPDRGCRSPSGASVIARQTAPSRGIASYPPQAPTTAEHSSADSKMVRLTGKPGTAWSFDRTDTRGKTAEEKPNIFN